MPSAFRVRTVAVGPERPFREVDWADALVLVERGEVELEGLSGARCRFRSGDVIWLSGVPLRALRSSGREPAVLVAVSRRRAQRP
jgi:hypothetical protein